LPIPLTDPTQAILRAKENKPNAITLDIMMPVKYGWGVLKYLVKPFLQEDIIKLITRVDREGMIN
jgi:CheY-like chemotaxis protein